MVKTGTGWIFGRCEAPDLKNVVMARQKNAELGTISNATEAHLGWTLQKNLPTMVGINRPPIFFD